MLALTLDEIGDRVLVVNRMKEALVMLGRLERAVVRPPLMKLGDAELARLRAALDEARIATEGALGLAA